MKVKKAILFLFVFLICAVCYAEEGYKLSVVSADDMSVSDNFVSLEGNVVISFSTSDDTASKDRELSADKVIIDIDNKSLSAMGDVYLSEGAESTFQGQALSLKWDTLDIVVFGGTSSSDRKSASGNNVKFYIVGDRISYSGNNETVFFRNGIIATREKDPYWSVNAKKIGLAGSDLFFSNATLRLGRVPIFWLPVLFYPGNRLSFNPAIGYSSSKGAFLNTTYELYGVYPKIGASSSSFEGDTSALASNFISFLETDNKVKEIRSGWSYIPQSEVEDLSDVQKWALDSGSYFVVFADAWEESGLSLGYETYNKFKDLNLTLSSTGVVGYRLSNPLRYSFELDGTYKYKDLSLSLKLPVISDPTVRFDFLNRNTVFGIDAVLGAKQEFPKTYSADINSYSIVLDGSMPHISSIKAQIDYKWKSAENKYLIESAKLPYISMSFSGNIIDKKVESKKTLVKSNLPNKTAQAFYDELSEISDIETDSSVLQYDGINFLKGKEVTTEKEVTSKAAFFKTDYSYTQVLDNSYSDKFEHDSFFIKIDSSLNASGRTGGDWFDFSDSIKPVLSTTFNENKSNSSDFKLTNQLSLSVPKAGISYSLKNYIYRLEKNDKKDESGFGEWDKTDVLEHYLKVSEKFGNFNFEFKYVLPPLDQAITPKVSYSYNGFSASFDTSFKMKKDENLKPSTSNLSLSYKNGSFSSAISSKYNFEKKGWDGFSGKENISYKFLQDKFVFSQDLSFEKQFETKSLAFSLGYGKNKLSISFKDKEVLADKFNLNLFYETDPIYFWKNRVGIEGSVNFGFTYDFQNKYNSSLNAGADINFAISKFLDLAVSVTSVNNSFYRYYDNVDGNERFNFSSMYKDLIRSFDFFGDGRLSTGFNLKKFSVSAVHYMEDWTLTLNAASDIKKVQGKSKFVPSFTFLIKWDAIPELKSTNSWDKTNGWEE